EAVTQERQDRVACAGDEEPLVSCAEVAGVGAEHPRGVVRWVDAERDETHGIAGLREGGRQRRQPPRGEPTGGGAGAESGGGVAWVRARVMAPRSGSSAKTSSTQRSAGVSAM